MGSGRDRGRRRRPAQVPEIRVPAAEDEGDALPALAVLAQEVVEDAVAQVGVEGLGQGPVVEGGVAAGLGGQVGAVLAEGGPDGGCSGDAASDGLAPPALSTYR